MAPGVVRDVLRGFSDSRIANGLLIAQVRVLGEDAAQVPVHLGQGRVEPGRQGDGQGRLLGRGGAHRPGGDDGDGCPPSSGEPFHRLPLVRAELNSGRELTIAHTHREKSSVIVRGLRQAWPVDEGATGT